MANEATAGENKTTQAMALEYLMRHAPHVLKCQREDGAFFPFPEWKQPSNYHQYCLYPLAYLYVTPEAGKFHHDRALLNAARASMRYMSALQLADGRFPLHSRGSVWGDSFDEWWTYFAVETWQLLRPHLDAVDAALWEKTIRRSLDGCVKHVQATLGNPKFPDANNVANHFVWFLVVVYRAGHVFGCDEWRKLAEGGLQRVVAAQQPGGYWHEGGGPTTLYNFVTTVAIGLYALDSQNEAAWQAVRRAELFHRAFTYPDGVPVETIDGRVLYTGHAMAILPVAFTHSPAGQAYVQRQIQCLLRQPFEDGFQGYAFFTDVARHAGSVTPAETPLDVHVLPNRQAAIIKPGDWVCAASAIVTPAVDSRWIQDRQNHLSLWHRQTGLILGGGNSKQRPMFSTLVVEDAAGQVQAYTASIATLRRIERTTLGLDLTVAEESVAIDVELLDGHTARLQALWRGPGHGKCVWQLPLRLDAMVGLNADGAHHVLGEEELTLAGKKLGHELKNGAWSLRWDETVEASLHWPVLPATPYFKDEKLAKKDRAHSIHYGVLRFRLRESLPAQVTLSVAKV